ncbi:hypothetical protein Tco_0911605 [Tanacetum coccineum]|uniref:Uncharacterized protein n=1 Tax=Tanacetum coccineum TaxID=301880 RepID=A0ABQ5CXC3_9ASTR
MKVCNDADIKNGRHSTSSYSTFHYRSSSHQPGDDEEIQEEDLTQDDVKTLLAKHKPLSPNAPNAPFKTPSTRGTSSSSSIASKLNSSPFYSSTPSTNPYLSSNNSPPPRVSHHIPSHEHQPMDITLTLSPITPLDFAFNTPSAPPLPSPPIVAHLIPFNLLDAHGATCLCCLYNQNLINCLRGELQFMFSYIEHLLPQPSIPNSPPPNPSAPPTSPPAN